MRALTQDDALDLAHTAADTIGEITGDGFTESEEAELAILIYQWAGRKGVERQDPPPKCTCQGFFRPVDCPVHGQMGPFRRAV